MYTMYTFFMKVILNATAVRQNFFKILLASRDKKQITKISYQGELVAELVLVKTKEFDWDKYIKRQKLTDKAIRGADWSDLKSLRKGFSRRLKSW